MTNILIKYFVDNKISNQYKNLMNANFKTRLRNKWWCTKLEENKKIDSIIELDPIR